MNKRIIALLLCCVFCLTALFSGCGEVAQNDNEQGGIVGDGGLGALATENKEEGAVSKFSKELIDAVTPEVLALAEKNELTPSQVNSYAAYKMYLLQEIKDINTVRYVLAPGRTADIPVDKIFDTSLMTLYNVNYYLRESDRENADNAVYFRDAFGTPGKADFTVKVFYMIPGEAKTAAEAVDKVVYTKLTTKNLGCSIKYIDYNASMYENGETTQLKHIVNAEKTVNIVSYNDSLCLGYDVTSELSSVAAFSNNVLIYVTFGGDRDYATLKTQLSTAVTDCFSVDTIDKATAQFNEITNVGTISTAN